MKYGARNQIPVKISKVKKGEVMTHVTLEISGDAELASVMTTDSVDNLDLKEGESVKAVVKAINVLLVKED